MRKLILLLSVLIMGVTSCDYTMGERVKGNGNSAKSDRDHRGFTGIKSSGPFDIYVSQDSTFKVRVEAESNLLDYIETYVEDGVLIIGTKDGYNLNSSRPMRVYIQAPSYTRIKTFGSGDILTEGKLVNFEPIELESTGSGDIKAEINAPQVKVDITGSGNVNLAGETKDFIAEINGSGDVKAFDLKSENSRVEILGSGGVDLYASVKLDVKVHGSGDVRYKGNGEVHSSISGSGNVKKVN